MRCVCVAPANWPSHDLGSAAAAGLLRVVVGKSIDTQDLEARDVAKGDIRGGRSATEQLPCSTGAIQ